MESSWEDFGIRTLEGVTDAATRLGAQYANVWLSREQFEAQLDSYERLARLQPRPAVAPLGLFLLIGLGVLLVART